jgi:hypothetical protein
MWKEIVRRKERDRQHEIERERERVMDRKTSR